MSEPVMQLVDDQTVDPINRNDIVIAEHAYQRWQAVVPSSLTEETITNPDLWVHKSQYIQPDAEIRVLAEDRSWLAHLFVIEKYGNQLIMTVLDFHRIEETTAPDVESEYFVENRRGEGWCIVQRSTGDVIQSKLGKQSAAMEALEQYLSVLRR